MKYHFPSLPLARGKVCFSVVCFSEFFISGFSHMGLDLTTALVLASTDLFLVILPTSQHSYLSNSYVPLLVINNLKMTQNAQESAHHFSASAVSLSQIWYPGDSGWISCDSEGWLHCIFHLLVKLMGIWLKCRHLLLAFVELGVKLSLWSV